EGYQHANFALLGVDGVHDANEVREWAVHNLHPLVLRETDLDARSLHLHPTENPLDLGLLERARMGACAHKARDTGCVAYHVPRVVWRHALFSYEHLNEHVARKNLALHGSAL